MCLAFLAPLCTLVYFASKFKVFCNADTWVLFLFTLCYFCPVLLLDNLCQFQAHLPKKVNVKCVCAKWATDNLYLYSHIFLGHFFITFQRNNCLLPSTKNHLLTFFLVIKGNNFIYFEVVIVYNVFFFPRLIEPLLP